MIATPKELILEAKPRQRDLEDRLVRELEIPSLLAAVLVSRGYTTPELAHNFLKPSLSNLGDPKKLPDFWPAAKEILGARERGELIFIHGDYDVDGVTSASLLKRCLEKLGCKVYAHVPHRIREGYGIHTDAIKKAHEMGAKLLLTCDCGTSAANQIAMAHEFGMRVVVTDHHEIGDSKVEAEAFMNPHRTDSEYGFKELCGVGVVFRLCEGLTSELGHNIENFRRAYLDLATLGTIADMMPLHGENRIIVWHGLQRIQESRKPGVQALIEVSDLRAKKITAGSVGYQLAPRLNAAGRIDDSKKALDLLLCEDKDSAEPLAAEINAINLRRREQQEQILAEAIERVSKMNLDELFAITVAHEDWHPGIIGLAAGKLVEQFHRPSYVLAIDHEQGIAKGSARSIPGFNLYDSIKAHEHLLQGGGHAMAAGFSCNPQAIQAITEALNDYAKSKLTSDDFVPKVEVDLEISHEEISKSAVQSLNWLEPFGEAHREPTFLLRNMTISDVRQARNNTVQLKFKDESGNIYKGACFQTPEIPEGWCKGATCSIATKIRMNEYGAAEFRPQQIAVRAGY